MALDRLSSVFHPSFIRCEVFKQHKCGSIVHAHWQIITTPFVPSSVDVGVPSSSRLSEGIASVLMAFTVMIS